MTDDNGWLENTDRKILNWLWRKSRPTKGVAMWGQYALQVAYLSLRNFFGRSLSFQASALTFITILGLVPALAISFSLAKGLGFADSMRALLINEYTEGQHQVMEYILSYVDRTNVGALGIVGLALLVTSLVLALSNAENAFNRIWDVKHTRTIFRKFTDYLSVLVICPLLIVAGTGIWAGMASNEVVQWLTNQAVIGEVASMGLRLGPLLMLALGFIFMYMFLPNTRVPLVSALIAGVVASAMWWGVQSVYIQFQVGVAKYNAIYGGFASLPLFLVWLHVSWTVVLYGAELAHTDYLCRNDMIPEAVLPPISASKRQALTLDLMMLISRRFHGGQQALPLNSLAKELGITRNQAAGAAEPLVRAGLLTPPDDNDVMMPARDLSSISARELATAVGAGIVPGADDAAADPVIGGVLAKLCNAVDGALGETTLLDLVRTPGQEV